MPHLSLTRAPTASNPSRPRAAAAPSCRASNHPPSSCNPRSAVPQPSITTANKYASTNEGRFPLLIDFGKRVMQLNPLNLFTASGLGRWGPALLAGPGGRAGPSGRTRSERPPGHACALERPLLPGMLLHPSSPCTALTSGHPPPWAGWTRCTTLSRARSTWLGRCSPRTSPP